MKRLFLAVSDDKYELPVAVSDTAEELAKMCETTKGTILSEISHAKKYTKHRAYHRVDYTDDEWEEL